MLSRQETTEEVQVNDDNPMVSENLESRDLAAREQFDEREERESYSRVASQI